MKKILILLGLWIVLVVFITAKAISNNLTSEKTKEILRIQNNSRCGEGPSQNELFMESNFAGVRVLGELEEKCQTQAGIRAIMYFTIMPKDKIVAKELAGKAAGTLEEFKNKRINPIVVVEPDSDWGLIDFNEFNSGFYDGWIEDFFKELKALNISNEMMGIWVPFPEANLPYWNHQNTKPADFAKAVNRYLGILKKYFPNTKASILLNSATYETDDWNWSSGEYVSLRSYLENLKKENLDSFGIQGLPWMPAKDEEGKVIFEPAEYLNTALIEEAVEILGTKKIWFNTGTFAAKYTQTPEKTVLVPAEIRKEILGKTLEQALKLKQKGYEVAINIFSEDKSDGSEATDWSYWGSKYTENTAHQTALVDFLRDCFREGIGVSFYFK